LVRPLVAVRDNCHPVLVEHPKVVGDRTTLAVMLGLQRMGYTILVPFGENTRYDLVIDDGRDLARVQCKTGRLRNGSVLFATCSTYGHHPNPAEVRRPYSGQIDYFGVHCLDTGGVYLIPIQDVPNRREVALRVEPTRNGQSKRVRRAADYEIYNVALSGALRASAGA
jgi:PD-(D/E)XK nuclease superfamily protein